MRSLFALAVIVAPAVASAGTYVSIGVGTTPSGQGELEAATAQPASEVPTQRVALGQSWGRLAVEASLGRHAIGAGDAVAAGVHARLTLPLDAHFGLYGRLGMERAWLDGLDARLGEQADGMVAGAGIEYRLRLPLLGEAAVWAEGAQDRLEFADGSRGGVRIWSIGATLGL